MFRKKEMTQSEQKRILFRHGGSVGRGTITSSVLQQRAQKQAEQNYMQGNVSKLQQKLNEAKARWNKFREISNKRANEIEDSDSRRYYKRQSSLQLNKINAEIGAYAKAIGKAKEAPYTYESLEKYAGQLSSREKTLQEANVELLRQEQKVQAKQVELKDMGVQKIYMEGEKVMVETKTGPIQYASLPKETKEKLKIGGFITTETIPSTDKVYSESQSAKIAKWSVEHQMTPTPSKARELAGEKSFIEKYGQKDSYISPFTGKGMSIAPELVKEPKEKLKLPQTYISETPYWKVKRAEIGSYWGFIPPGKAEIAQYLKKGYNVSYGKISNFIHSKGVEKAIRESYNIGNIGMVTRKFYNPNAPNQTGITKYKPQNTIEFILNYKISKIEENARKVNETDRKIAERKSENLAKDYRTGKISYEEANKKMDKINEDYKKQVENLNKFSFNASEKTQKEIVDKILKRTEKVTFSVEAISMFLFGIVATKIPILAIPNYLYLAGSLLESPSEVIENLVKPRNLALMGFAISGSLTASGVSKIIKANQIKNMKVLSNQAVSVGKLKELGLDVLSEKFPQGISKADQYGLVATRFKAEGFPTMTKNLIFLSKSTARRILGISARNLKAVGFAFNKMIRKSGSISQIYDVVLVTTRGVSKAVKTLGRIKIRYFKVIIKENLTTGRTTTKLIAGGTRKGVYAVQASKIAENLFKYRVRIKTYARPITEGVTLKQKLVTYLLKDNTVKFRVSPQFVKEINNLFSKKPSNVGEGFYKITLKVGKKIKGEPSSYVWYNEGTTLGRTSSFLWRITKKGLTPTKILPKSIRSVEKYTVRDATRLMRDLKQIYGNPQRIVIKEVMKKAGEEFGKEAYKAELLSKQKPIFIPLFTVAKKKIVKEEKIIKTDYSKALDKANRDYLDRQKRATEQFKKQRNRQITIQRNREKELEKQRKRIIFRTRLSEREMSKQLRKQIVIPKSATMQKQVQKQRFVTRQIFAPFVYPQIYPIKPEIKPKIIFPPITKQIKSKKIVKKQGYVALVKRYGQWFKISPVVSRETAIYYGVQETRQSLGARFKIVKSKYPIQMKVGFKMREPPEKIFRKYKVKHKKRIPLEEEWIQKAPTRLASFGERREIQRRRKMVSTKRKLKKQRIKKKRRYK